MRSKRFAIPAFVVSVAALVGCEMTVNKPADAPQPQPTVAAAATTPPPAPTQTGATSVHVTRLPLKPGSNALDVNGNAIQFNTGAASLKGDQGSIDVLNKVVHILGSTNSAKIRVDGHTDNQGPDSYNMQLSQQRADAVKGFLVAAGVDGSRVTTKGYGPTKPVADNATEEGRAQNRRVEFRVTELNGQPVPDADAK